MDLESEIKRLLLLLLLLVAKPNQVSQFGSIPLLVHYFFCLFNKNVKILQE